MDSLLYIKNRFMNNETISRTIGNDELNGIISCGFLRKKESSDIDLTFKHYGALLLLDGRGKYVDEDGTSISLTPGSFIQRLPGKKHSTFVEKDGKWLEVYVCLGTELYLSLVNIGVINDKKPVLQPGLDFILLQKFIQFFEALKKATLYELPFLLLKAQEIVILAHDLDAKHSRGTSLSIINKAIDIIDSNIKNNISVKDISKEINMGYENFRKLFKSNTGLSPKAYMVQRRIDASKVLLLDSNKNISEISNELGYENPFIFSKQFKEIVGVSPLNYKKQFLNT